MRRYADGEYCALPHVIELMQADYDPLCAVLEQEEEIKVLINPFISAFRNKAKEQLEGQIASAKIGLARLSSPQLEYAVPASKIASLSSGEFVGIVADNPGQKIKLKVFNSEMQNDHGAIKSEEDKYSPIPVIKQVSATDIQKNYLKIKADIENLFQTELQKIGDRNQNNELNHNMSRKTEGVDNDCQSLSL